jgi:hypothetical protein
VDVEACIKNEVGQLSGNSAWNVSQVYHMKIMFEPRAEGAWSLGFEWAFDPEAPGHLLVFEHHAVALGVEELRRNTWPFHKVNRKLSLDDIYRIGPKWNARSDRRLAAKVRK